MDRRAERPSRAASAADEGVDRGRWSWCRALLTTATVASEGWYRMGQFDAGRGIWPSPMRLRRRRDFLQHQYCSQTRCAGGGQKGTTMGDRTAGRAVPSNLLLHALQLGVVGSCGARRPCSANHAGPCSPDVISHAPENSSVGTESLISRFARRRRPPDHDTHGRRARCPRWSRHP